VRTNHNLIRLATLILVCLGCGLFAWADPVLTKDPGLFPWLNYRYSVDVLNTATFVKPADSTANPGNDVLAVSQLTLGSQVRVNLNADAGPMSFLLRPRFNLQRESWDDGIRDGESDSDASGYINEWQARLSLYDKAFLSYGRENLQWGPAFLFSPSNPFTQNNGQLNPKGEVPGMDYAKLLWVPGGGWAASFIANVGEGRADISRNGDSQYAAFTEAVNTTAQGQLNSIDQQYQQGLAQIDALRTLFPERRRVLHRIANRVADRLEGAATQQRDNGVAQVNGQVAAADEEAALERDAYNREFHNTYALKLDYQALQKYGSLIASYQESDQDEDIRRLRLGGYAGVTASDALLLYTEASASLRGDELYPVDDPGSPFGARFARTRSQSDDFRGTALVGGSYTLEGGHTFVAEYLYNGRGYSRSEASRYYALREQAADALSQPEPFNTLALATLGMADDPGLFFMRQNYLMLQYQQIQIVGDLGVVLRCTFNLDDRSIQLVPILQYNLNDHWQLFAVGNQNFGRENTEFTSFIDRFYQFGVQYSF